MRLRFLAFLLVVGLAGCGKEKEQPAAAGDWRAGRKEIKLAVSGNSDDPMMVQRRTAYREHLTKAAGIPVRLFESADYNGVIQALSSGQVDIAQISGGGYANVDAQVGNLVTPLLTPRQAEGDTGYYSILVVRADSPVRSLQDMKGRALGWVDYNSTSGYLYPRARMRGGYGLDTPAELRDWNDTAPRVAVGMEGAPGHQAGALNPDGSLDPEGARGGYGNAPTLGGFDQMTARLGGFWDSMLGEGRGWWITSSSDSHRHFTEGGNDFWPGQYSKTYVKAARSHADILDGLRNGRVFVTTGDLVSELEVTAQVAGQAGRPAEIGGRLAVPAGSDVLVVIRLRDPAGKNHGGRSPRVARVDLIRGEVTGPAANRSADHNPTTRVETRFAAGGWARDGERLSMAFTLKNVRRSGYVRVRGTAGAELEPMPDAKGEDPWSDLWFYANPIFLEVR